MPDTPNAKQESYIRRLVAGVAEHAAELDAYIEQYAKGWRFERIPLVASAIMRVAMYRDPLYAGYPPRGGHQRGGGDRQEATSPPEVVKFINGILGSFLRAEVQGMTAHQARARQPCLVFDAVRKEGSRRWSAYLRRVRGQRTDQGPAGRRRPSCRDSTSGASCPTIRSIPPATTTSP